LLRKEVDDPRIIIKAICAVQNGEAYLTPFMTFKIVNVVRRSAVSNKFQLTKREAQILKLIATGKDNRGIGNALSIKESTVANHVYNLLDKMHVKNRTEAAVIALRDGLAGEQENRALRI
jgi:DNA-binding NarL/FixJ family response regulator